MSPRPNKYFTSHLFFLALFPAQNYTKGHGKGYTTLYHPILGTQCINPLFVTTSSRPRPHRVDLQCVGLAMIS